MQPQQTPPAAAQSNGFQFTVTPQNMMSAFNTASTVMNNLNKFGVNLGGKAEPPSRPAPVPGAANGANPMVPQ
jgi:hypothetical protein